MDNPDRARRAIAEIAGRDSVAAVVAAVRDRGFTTVLPTIGYTGTETGDFDAPIAAVGTLRRLLGDACEVLDPIHLEDRPLWSALNTRFSADIERRYGVCSPCLACHLYFHLLRVPLSWEHDSAPVIAGERDTHDGRIKLSQTTQSIDASIRVLAHAGIELLQPIRSASGDTIAQLVGSDWDEGAGQLGCLLSGNYRNEDGSVDYDEDGYARYVRGFFESAGRGVVDTWKTMRDETPSTALKDLDYAGVLGSILKDSPGDLVHD